MPRHKKKVNSQHKLLSAELHEKLGIPCWYHGTNMRFSAWQCPPPPTPGNELSVPHTGLFFSSNWTFANNAGTYLAATTLRHNARILDTIANTSATERLRLAIANHPVAKMTRNIDKTFWHEGWRTGDVLRIHHTRPALDQYFKQYAAQLCANTTLTMQAAEQQAQLNITRGFIELVCVTAKNQGFDAIYGYERDSESHPGLVVAQPWLAVMSKTAITPPEWL
ncbi:hypothetical protein [Alteromonas macleodii]|uniref:RES domain-containing protein n=1 Tax=Alteromonas macleodii TaxID=28108 RepID=A0AB36FKM1_ALTMA|nr:hypothetical protein [Alteromonas macleodii]OES24493.1 hypothetical protein BFV95_4760 [Alteromonas macleodii]OES25550.1 hypothetical protein BFV94_4403 [Alteromonas macleodii]OES25851.1 hypothetical protein BFV93_4314 [Alteromonas macleodii]OES38627.1 hypothetical protein BFV96_4738 [Alteromonas macleodii]